MFGVVERRGSKDGDNDGVEKKEKARRLQGTTIPQPWKLVLTL